LGKGGKKKRLREGEVVEEEEEEEEEEERATRKNARSPLSSSSFLLHHLSLPKPPTFLFSSLLLTPLLPSLIPPTSSLLRALATALALQAPHALLAPLWLRWEVEVEFFFGRRRRGFEFSRFESFFSFASIARRSATENSSRRASRALSLSIASLRGSKPSP